MNINTDLELYKYLKRICEIINLYQSESKEIMIFFKQDLPILIESEMNKILLNLEKNLEKKEKEIIKKIKELEKEIKKGLKIKINDFCVALPTPKLLQELKMKDYELVRQYGMLKMIKDIKKEINKVIKK